MINSSRIRTVRCSGHLLGGVCPGGVCLGEVSAQEVPAEEGVFLVDVCPGGVCLEVFGQGGLPRGVSAQGVGVFTRPPSCEQND